MKFCFNNSPCCRVLAAGVALAFATGGLRADSIIFTRPAIAIVTPATERDDLPLPREKGMDFAAPNQHSMRHVPQIISPPPAPRNADDDENQHWLMKDPRKLPGFLGKDPLKLPPVFAEKNPLRLPWQSREADPKEENRSLSPITSFDWNEREQRDSKKNHLADNEPQDRRREEEERQDFWKSREARGEDQRDAFRSGTGFDPNEVRPREKLTVAELERRANFQAMLNPRPVASARQPGALEPITAFDSPKSDPARPVASVPVSTRPLFQLAPMDPTETFQKQQQARFRNDSLDDPGKKYSAQPASKSNPLKTESPFPTPLMRQPIQHEIPARKF